MRASPTTKNPGSRKYLEETPHTLYRHYDKDDNILYIGITHNLRHRTRMHRKQRTWWFNEVSRTETEEFEDKASALEAEQKAIRDLEPPHNAEIHYMDTRLWPQQKFITHGKALALARLRDSIDERSGLGRLYDSYKRKFRRDLFEDLGEVPRGYRHAVPDLDLSPSRLNTPYQVIPERRRK